MFLCTKPANQATGFFPSIHRKKKVREFPVPSRDVTTKLSLGGNNDVITELFLPRETREPFFTVYNAKYLKHFSGGFKNY